MSTLRQDPTTRQWAILATRRGERPHDPVVVPRPQLPEFDPACPFCPGNEDQTPPEIMRVPPDDTWHVRVVPNMYAALTGDGATSRTGEPMFREMPGVGSHEVVIETPRHDGRMDEVEPDQMAGVVWMWRERYRRLIARPDVRAVVVFKNFGALAGTSLTHPHSQIVATPVFLPRLQRRLDVATRYYDEHGSCVYDDVIGAERRTKVRVVDDRGSFIAFEPWAAQSPFETWIAPTSHQGSFGDLSDEHIDDLAHILTRTLRAVRTASGDPDYNLVMYSAPSNEGHATRVFHWHLKLIPRIATQAGFEIGSAMSINTMAPEDAAGSLRDALANV
ncbi:MAG TPA: galactose-1-phosphate uridylyltransferase [Actinomycetota bacterium]|nr:galactose-1-phosphate uridylyltransferase [Actinomycetota bacterium]